MLKRDKGSYKHPTNGSMRIPIKVRRVCGLEFPGPQKVDRLIMKGSYTLNPNPEP